MSLIVNTFVLIRLLEHSLNEAKRLRRIIHENDGRAKEFLEELERLRGQIMAKNSTIRQLERLAHRYSTGRSRTSSISKKPEKT